VGEVGDFPDEECGGRGEEVLAGEEAADAFFGGDDFGAVGGVWVEEF